MTYATGAGGEAYIIIVFGATSLSRDVFTSYLQGSGIPFWHWMPEAWIVIDQGASPTAEKWRELALAHLRGLSGVQVFVGRLQGDFSVHSSQGSLEWFRQVGWYVREG